jgi:hypothetical protein
VLRRLPLLLALVSFPASAVTLNPGDVLLNVPFVHRVVSPGVTQQVVPSAGAAPIAGDLTMSGLTPFAVGLEGSLDRIYRINAGPETKTAIGSTFTASEHVFDLVSSSTGTLYGLAQTNGGQRFYGIDPSSGARSLLFENGAASGPFAGRTVRGVSFLDANTAIGSGLAGGGALFSYDLTSGSTTLLVEGGEMTATPDTGAFTYAPLSVVVIPDGRVLVASENTNSGSHTVPFGLFEVDLVTGSQRFVTSGTGLPVDLEISGNGATAYVAGASFELGGQLSTIDVATGATSRVGYDFAFGVNPGIAIVPEPGTLLLTSLGLAILGARRTRAG